MCISEKYGLETHKFLACFLDAWIHEKSSCNDILIQCRQKTKNDGIFLVTEDERVIAQLGLSEEALKRLPDVDLTSYPWNQFALANSTTNPTAVDARIKELDLRVEHLNPKARIVEKSILES
jgi:hypothetical protein